MFQNILFEESALISQLFLRGLFRPVHFFLSACYTTARRCFVASRRVFRAHRCVAARSRCDHCIRRAARVLLPLSAAILTQHNDVVFPGWSAVCGPTGERRRAGAGVAPRTQASLRLRTFFLIFPPSPLPPSLSLRVHVIRTTHTRARTIGETSIVLLTHWRVGSTRTRTAA